MEAAGVRALASLGRTAFQLALRRDDAVGAAELVAKVAYNATDPAEPLDLEAVVESPQLPSAWPRGMSIPRLRSGLRPPAMAGRLTSAVVAGVESRRRGYVDRLAVPSIRAGKSSAM
jgi:hypothetical protein